MASSENRSFPPSLNRATTATKMIARPPNQTTKNFVQSSMMQLVFLPVHTFKKLHAPLASAVPAYSHGRPFIPVSIHEREASTLISVSRNILPVLGSKP
jgi:hypothetical protein